MALRPIAFSIPSTTELKVTFSENLSEKLSKNNFQVESLNGAVSDTEVIGLTINGAIVIVKTRPHVSGNYYILRFIDTEDIIFASENGSRLLDGNSTRELFFVGIDKVNPFRDRMLRDVPKLFDVENTTLRNIITAQAEEMFRAQVAIGQNLSNNYISIDVEDEIRTRGSGATDRLANENAYEIIRVSDKPSTSLYKYGSLNYTLENSYESLQSIPSFPISLQEELISDEEISSSSSGNDFNGYLISLSKKNIIKILSVTLIGEDDQEDCNGNIGNNYNIDICKYSILDNTFDQKNAFSFSKLENNQFLLSEFGNLRRPITSDRIIVSYLYKDLGKYVIEDSVSVSKVLASSSEYIPSSSIKFYLNHAPIVNSNNEIYSSKGGVKFKVNENSNVSPDEFKTEVLWGTRMPRLPGEYSVNYETGEVLVVGSEAGVGTGRNYYFADYNYRKTFINDLDYAISNQKFVVCLNRGLVGAEAEIAFNYDKVFAEGVDYLASSHMEVINEQVENRLTGSFSLRTEKSPITDVFRILNQTTGEIYNPLYYSDTEIFFSGNRSPEIIEIENEVARFDRVVNEKLEIIGELVAPCFEMSITSNSSNNSIEFEPGIPAELISFNSNSYFIRTTESNDDSINVTDLQVRFFSAPDSNNLINSLAISSTATPPSLRSKVILGPKVFQVYLSNEGIMNKSLDAIGNLLNTSLSFSDINTFVNPKHYNIVDDTSGIRTTSDGGISKALISNKGTEFYKNISRLRKVGDYTVDYANGIVFVAIDLNQEKDIGKCSYSHYGINTRNKNVLNATGATKKVSSSDLNDDAKKVYDNLSNTPDIVKILDLEPSLSMWDGETLAGDLNGEYKTILEVLDDYTVVLPNNILSISSINEITDLTGADLNRLNQIDRISESPIDSLMSSVTSGGKNIYDSNIISYTKNVIDLKTTKRRRVYTDILGNLSVTINDEYASTFHSVKLVRTGLELFDDSLNITKISNIKIFQTESGIGSATVYISTSSISDIDTDNDFLMDSDGNIFEITDVNTVLSTITVSSPATNNITALLPNVDSNGFDTYVVVKPTVTISNNSLTISIPSDAPIISGDLLEIVYLTSLVPEIGTPLAIDYRYGYIYIDYNYIKDRIAVSYEYGDNSIDWSIGGSLTEGENYYVTYKYGAGREALRSNFGSLTNIPFFEEFPLNTDRELYRDAIAGTLQTFPNGPTVPAFQELVKSFTHITPEIEELSFGKWILGRDYLHIAKPEFNGDLEYRDCKFDDGLVFQPGTTVSIPAISSLSLEEGTIEAWVKPNWSGISNDASLTFNIDNIGVQKFYTDPKDKIFNSGWAIHDSDSTGGVDDLGLGFRYFNYKSDESAEGGITSGYFLLKNYIEHYNQSANHSQNIRIKQQFASIRYASDSNFYNLSQNYNFSIFGMSDGFKLIAGELSLERLFDVNFVSNYNIESTDISNYNRNHYLRSCNCSVVNNVAILSKFNSELIEIEFDTAVDMSSAFSVFNIIDDAPEALEVVDSTGTHWQVKAFVEAASGSIVTRSIPNSIIKVLVERFPINDRHISMSGADAINLNLPSGELNIYGKVFKSGNTDVSDSINAFNIKQKCLVNWSEYIDIKIEKILSENKVSIKVKNFEYDMFYTDMLNISNSRFLNIDNFVSGALIGVVDDNVYSEAQVFRNRITIYNKFSLNDIYIGQNGYNPSSNPFTINRSDTPLYSLGIPSNIDMSDGIFIGYDELCKSALSDVAGQWFFKTRATRGVNIPESVTFSGDSYVSNFVTHEVNYKFSGFITTDGAFSSVINSKRNSLNECFDSGTCNSAFRFCGESLLEDVGWVNLEDVDSTLINTIIGGRETYYEPWIKIGAFETSVSGGIYRIVTGTSDVCREEEGNYLYSRIPCDKNVEITTSMRVVSIPTNILEYGLGSFSGSVSGILTGIVPINLVTSNGNIKIVLALSNTLEPLIAIYDGQANQIVDYISYNWHDDAYHEYKLVSSQDNEIVRLYVDNLLLSQIYSNTFDNVVLRNESYMAVHGVDGSIVSMEDFESNGIQYIVDIDLIEYSGTSQDADLMLESSDIFIATESKIEFEFNIDTLDGYWVSDGYDGYDGYVQPVVGMDEILICADRPKYLIDTAINDYTGRMSVFKDGKGFLNFRIYDDSLQHNKNVGMFNLATNIKNWESSELHHIAVSWKLNSINEKDEMHLFVDGFEAPNIYKFGGTVPLKVNAKFSDVSQESLYNFLTNDVVFCDTHTDGTILAGSSLFSSDNIQFTDEMIGRSILMLNSSIADNLIGGEFIIKSVVNGSAIFGSGSSLETVVFSVSANDIEFKFPPTAGIRSSILTDIRNSKFTIIRTTADSITEELGGILYEIEDNEISIVSGSNIENPKFRANLKTRVIEFLGEDENCNIVPTIISSDIDVHIETFGLNLQRCRQIIDLSASSYVTDDTPHSGTSILRVYDAKPLALSDVIITRIVLDKTILEAESIDDIGNNTYAASFSVLLDNESKKISSESGRVNKQNLGRLLNIWFDSDNTVFCETDGYTDGYTVGGDNLVTVYGTTTDGTNEETFVINKNGYAVGTKFFKTVSRVDGNLIIADPNYFELGMISIEEADSITTSNNNGDYAEIYEWRNGTFKITTYGSQGTFPFELHLGKYRIDYPAYLRLSLPQVGSKLYIGSDFSGKNSWDGVIDEFRIISEMSNDTRSYEAYTSGTRSITKDFNSTDTFCSDEQTLALIHFDNPIDKFNRRLRIKEYLNEENNIKYKLTTDQREELLPLVGKSKEFVNAMINMGFDKNESEITYYETLYADNGPIVNEAYYYNNFSETQISSESVNDSFGKSGYFKSGSGLLFNNDLGYFRHSEGTIEFWVSPILDTKVDTDRKYYIDIADIKRERIKSKSSTVIELNSAAKSIESIRLLTSATRYESFYTEEESSSILFDEISKHKINKKLVGGTGTEKDFNVGAKLSANGKVIYLSNALPGQNIDIVVTYVPIDSSGDRISIFKNEYNQIVFGITADGIDHIVTSDVDWRKNTWHRVMCMYKTGTISNDTMRIFVDGEEGGFIRYGTGLIYGTGYVYGQYIQKSGQAKNKDYRIDLGYDFRMLSVGSDVYGDNTARARMDNLRFSNIMRNIDRDAFGNLLDTNYSDNTETIYPVKNDDVTTFILDFDSDGAVIDKFATIIDSVNGIFNFDIDVIDNFNRVIGINNGEIEDLITDLVNRLKPAHTNALVKFKKSKC